jgi:membrane protease YdiL (CAAX protease family)
MVGSRAAWRVIVPPVLTAATFWCVLFSPWVRFPIGFWPGMAVAAGLLAAWAAAIERADLATRLRLRVGHVAIGLLSAAALYGIFWLGNQASRAILPSAGDEIAAVYARRGSASPTLIGALLLVWIGPAEEIFWRGFVQHRLSTRWGPLGGWLLGSAAYAAVHLWAGNLMLLLAAMLCGLFWGVIYWRWRSLWPVILSHAVWDVAIFVIAPV